MEENVNFDNEVLAYLTIRKVIEIVILNLNCVGPTDWEPQAVHSGAPRDQRGPQWLYVGSSLAQTSKLNKL